MLFTYIIFIYLYSINYISYTTLSKTGSIFALIIFKTNNTNDIYIYLYIYIYLQI